MKHRVEVWSSTDGLEIVEIEQNPDVHKERKTQSIKIKPQYVGAFVTQILRRVTVKKLEVE